MVNSEDQMDLNELYDFEDETGILDRHKQLIEEMRPSSASSDLGSEQLDIKIMFYELIRMICDFDSQNRNNNSLRQIYKIEGFQHLNNRLFTSKLRANREFDIYSRTIANSFISFICTILCNRKYFCKNLFD